QKPIHLSFLALLFQANKSSSLSSKLQAKLMKESVRRRESDKYIQTAIELKVNPKSRIISAHIHRELEKRNFSHPTPTRGIFFPYPTTNTT
ncbi:MAG TPA: hypothetical protein VHT73_17645, partial [Thermodesulfobacteriota bacterium]|nr:hypothetical protein [Thermodesulfobacteriota bacterium]